MRLDRANRGFLALLALGLLAVSVALWGALARVLVPLALAGPAHETAGRAGALVASVPFLTLLLAGLWRAGRALARQLLFSRRLARRVDHAALPLDGELTRAAAQVGLAGRVVLLEEPAAISFVYGLLNPRVALSRGLTRGASVEQLRAVLEHERYHVHNLDPLKGVLARTLAVALFLLPMLDRWRAGYLADRELAADRRAIAACGRRPLAGALLRVVGAGEWDELHAAATFGTAELIDARVAQLEGRAVRQQAGGWLIAWTLARSLIGVVALGAAFMAAVLGFGGAEAVRASTGSDLVEATLLGGLSCSAVPIGAAGLAYLLLALVPGRGRPVARIECGG